MGKQFRSIVGAALVTGLAIGPAAGAASAAGSDYLLGLGGVRGESADDKHKNQIEILSYSWGAVREPGQADALTDGLLMIRYMGVPGAAPVKGEKAGGGSPQPGAGKVEHEWKVEEGESAPPPPGGVRVAAGDVDGDGRADAASPRDAASGQATGKRQHRPVTFSAPLAKGSLTVRAKFPGCAVGTRYPTLTLGGRGKRYTLQDAIITSCARASGEALPMEEVSFNYAKIKF